MDSVEMTIREEQLTNLLEETFSQYKTYEQFEPYFPRVLVRILSRETRIGSLILPDSRDHNKPIWEGIVIRTWKPTTLFGKEVRSELSFGDHVLFPHFAGYELPGLHPEKYKVIPEGIQIRGSEVKFTNDVGVIIGKINYERPPAEEILTKIIYNRMRIDKVRLRSRQDVVMLLAYLQESFDIVPKEKYSRTKSGV